jgi:Sulfotransferase domain
MSQNNQRIPDFFILGAPKCGTTSLYHWLKTHPALSIPVKEPGYFARDLHPNGMDFESYLQFYRGPEFAGRLVGDASPKYLFSHKGIREISRLQPNAKCIVVLRNPVDLVFSFHWQMVVDAMESEADFRKAWDLMESRKSGASLPRGCTSPALLNYASWGLLGTRLQDVFSVFGRSRVLVFILDDLGLDPGGVYSKILGFLGVEHDGRCEFAAENFRRDLKSVWLQQMMVKLRRKVRPLISKKILHQNKGLGILRIIDRLNRRSTVNAPMLSQDLRAHLVDFFASEVDLLEELLARKLPAWKRADSSLFDG